MDFEAQKIEVIAENASIKNYLDELCAPLSEMPQAQRDEIRQEIGAHLQSLMAMKREPNRVLESALQQFGDPTEIGRLLALEWENRAWDSGGSSLFQQIEKVRSAAAQEDWQKTTLKKRERWITPLIMLPLLLFLAKDTVLHKSPHLVRVLDVTILLSCALGFAVSLIVAWLDWHNARMQEKSKINRIRRALSQVVVGLGSLMPLGFSANGSLSDTAMHLIIVPILLICALIIGLTAFEPSRKTKWMSATVMVSAVACFLFTLAGYALLSTLGITSIWVQMLIVGLVVHVLSRWFWKGKALAKRRQKVE